MADSQPDSLSFMEEFDCSDITLMVEDTPVYAVKSVLSLWSPVFKAMLSVDFLEKKENRIELPDKMLDEVVLLMRLMHPPDNMKINLSTQQAERLVPLAHEYQISNLLTRLEDQLLAAPFDVTYITLADTYGLLHLYEASMKKACNMSYLDVNTDQSFEEFVEHDPQLANKVLMSVMESQQKQIEKLEQSSLTQNQTITQQQEKIKNLKGRVQKEANFQRYAKEYLQKFPKVWYGDLQVQTKSKVSVQLMFVKGSRELLSSALPYDRFFPQTQRMTQQTPLSPGLIDTITQNMQDEANYSLLVALPYGSHQGDTAEQAQTMRTAFIEYLQQKNSAGVVAIAATGGGVKPVHKMLLFPPSTFTETKLKAISQGLLLSVSALTYLVILLVKV